MRCTCASATREFCQNPSYQAASLAACAKPLEKWLKKLLVYSLLQGAHLHVRRTAPSRVSNWLYWVVFLRTVTLNSRMPVCAPGSFQKGLIQTEPKGMACQPTWQAPFVVPLFWPCPLTSTGRPCFPHPDSPTFAQIFGGLTKSRSSHWSPVLPCQLNASTARRRLAALANPAYPIMSIESHRDRDYPMAEISMSTQGSAASQPG